MDKSLGILLNFWGVFQSHIPWTHVSWIFFPVSGCGEWKLQENFEKNALFYGSLCTNSPSPLRFLLKGGEGRLYTGYFMRETRNYLWILSWILKLWIIFRRVLFRIVFLSPLFSLLPCLLLYISIVFVPPPPLPHFHYFPSTNTTTRNTTYRG